MPPRDMINELSKWCDVPGSQTEPFFIIKLSLLPKLICKTETNPTKISRQRY